MKKLITFYILCALFISCKTSSKKEKETFSKTEKTTIKYAKGFKIFEEEGKKVLFIKSPYPKAKEGVSYSFSKNKEKYPNTITIPLQTVVVTSTTHIPMLEYLNVEDRLVGFSDTHYISSKKTRALINKNKIKEIGNDRNINTEILLDLQPDAFIGFTVDSNTKIHDNIRKAGIPVIINNAWLEETPLGRAEWIKFFGLLFDKEAKADSIFKDIEKRYLKIKSIAKGAKNTPSVIYGGLFKEVWYTPAGNSFKAAFFRDANMNYLWKDTEGTGSLPLNIESVFTKGKDADIWLSPSSYTSLLGLKKGNAIYPNFKAFKTKNVYSFAAKKGETGGTIFYELSPLRPDLVLKDLIKIAHPELLPNDAFTFYEKLK